MATKQITPRIPEELVDFVDDHVQNRSAKSRAAYLTAVLVKTKREEQEQRDAASYQEHGEDPDLTAFARAAYAARFGSGPELPLEGRDDFRRMYPRPDTERAL